MKIENSLPADIDLIFDFYEQATAYMRERSPVSWPAFDRNMVSVETEEKRQWKMIDGDTVVCIWATTFNDPLIWEEKNNDPAVYIHRIAVNPAYRGKNFVLQIVDWAKAYAAQHRKHFIRLDTVGDNRKLIEHYTKCGFDFLGLRKLNHTDGLPAHYHNASVSLFEIKLNHQ